MVQAVWPGSSQLLGWFRLCDRGRCLDGSGCVARQLLGWFRLCGQGLVSCLLAVWPGSSQLLGLCGWVAWCPFFMYCIEWK